MLQAEVLYPLGIFMLSLLVLFVYFHQLCFFFISLYTARYLMYPKRPTTLLEAPGVSVVKPLMGIDGCLRENLLSHFTMNYPRFELLFCVQNENDPVIQLLQSLCELYPHVNVRLFIGGKDGVINPMVHNMVPAYEAAKYDLVWVSTSRVKASTEVIWDFVDKANDPSVAIVHQLPFFSDHPGFVAAIEKVTFGCYMARSYVALNQLGVTCFTGMSYIVRKSMLDEVGGLAYFGKYLAEDYFLSSALCEKGYRIVMSSYPVMQNVGDSTLVNYIRRMVRWLRLRLNMLPLVSGVLEPLSESITLGLLFSLTMEYLFDVKFIQLLVAHFTMWIILDYTLLRCIQNSKLPFSLPIFLLAWITRELLVFVVFIKALSNPWCIKWGNYYYRVYLGGLTQRLPSNNSTSTSFVKNILFMKNTNFNHEPLKWIKKIFEKRISTEKNAQNEANNLLNSFYSNEAEENDYNCSNKEVFSNNSYNPNSSSKQQFTPVIIDSKDHSSSSMAGLSCFMNKSDIDKIVNNHVGNKNIRKTMISVNTSRVNYDESNLNDFIANSSRNTASRKITETIENKFASDMHINTTDADSSSSTGLLNAFVSSISGF
ncbi:unnamed protein product [Heterobilharzia americana]|nr:unnamed protein product [Heterobilharzia americana]